MVGLGKWQETSFNEVIMIMHAVNRNVRTHEHGRMVHDHE